MSAAATRARRWPHRPGDLAIVTAVALGVVAATLLTYGIAAQESPPQPPPWASTPRSVSEPASGIPGRAVHPLGRLPSRADVGLPRSLPTWIDVPAIGVHTKLISLGINPDHTLQVPPLNATAAGWYRYSPSPGQVGPSVILGHVDSATGPSVFFKLGALRPGDRVSVRRADGITVVFRVDRVVSYPKSRFPASQVYGNTDGPQLRLITCGGRFDSSRHTHLDNIVVYASSVNA
jgi:hypothetical protein